MVSPQIHSLKLFCDVVRQRSFSQAATENGITQSAASQTVQSIEQYVGTRLIDRSKRPLNPTDDGQRFFDSVHPLVRQLGAVMDEMRQSTGLVTGRVSVAAIYSIGLCYLPEVEQAFADRFPSASLTVDLAHPDDVYRAVESGAAEIGLVSFPNQTATLGATPWREEAMAMIAGPDHPLAGRRSIGIAELEGLPLVAFAPHLRIRRAIDKCLKAQNLRMRTVVELDNLDSVCHAVTVNNASAIVPEPAVAGELSSGSLVRLDIDRLSMTRPLGIVHRRDLSLSRAARGLIDLLRESVD